MARDLNRYICCGRLCRDPEMKYLPNQTAVASLSVAVNDSKKVGDKWEDVPVFLDVEVFGQPAEFIGQYGKKGSQVLIEGKLRLDQWNDKNSGEKRQKLKVVAESVRLLGGKDQAQRSETPDATKPRTGDGDDDGSIPF
jgi:single-strand DNA-binding protein